MTVPVFPIIPTTQQYDWGKIGLTSKVAQYANAAKAQDFNLNEEKPYAELWMGTHPKSPSRLEDGTTLSEHLALNPSLLGDDIIASFNAGDGNIPFLFKVLAIAKALSIQTHPDKAMAERLHAEKPDIYKDPNHKPEMAIALTPFTALCGFQPLPQIAAYLKSTPEFAALIPPTAISNFLSVSQSRSPTGTKEKTALRELFSALMTAEKEKFHEELEKLVHRYETGGAKKEEFGIKDLALTLNEQFPGDIGVFCVFVLNYVKLEKGEAIFLGAGEPHAYVSGDIIETMATSDNVVRAGLTPKLRDIPNLISGLTYTASDPSKHVIDPQAFDSSKFTELYDPPIPEFSVLRVHLTSSGSENHRAVNGPSILIVTEGSGKITWDGDGGKGSLEVSAGRVIFIGAKTPITLSTEDGLEVHRAYVEPKE